MVDLNDLEAGDSVKVKGGGDNLFNVLAIAKNPSFEQWRVYLFNLEFISLIQTNVFYNKGGDTQLFSEDDFSIIEIIKSPKRWTDDDMKEAFHHWQSRKTTDDDFYKWLEKYKANRNG